MDTRHKPSQAIFTTRNSRGAFELAFDFIANIDIGAAGQAAGRGGADGAWTCDDLAFGVGCWVW